LISVFGSELLEDSDEPLPGILRRQEHHFFALRFGKNSSNAEHGEGGQCGFFMVFSLKLIEGVGLNGG
jgi:hypothetical protein